MAVMIRSLSAHVLATLVAAACLGYAAVPPRDPGEMSRVVERVGSRRLLSRMTSTTWSLKALSVAGSPRRGCGPGSIGTPSAPPAGIANGVTWPQKGPTACWTPFVTGMPF